MERICLVEDDPTIREIVTERLQKEGYSVESFSEAEKLVQNWKDFDLYLLDVMLEGEQTGLELCGFIRKRDPLVPVLIISALTEPSDRIEGLKVGADDYLGKPFEMEELLLRVKGMLKRRSWYRALPEQGTVFSWEGRQVDFTKMEGCNGNQVFQLSQKECMLMKLLIEKEGQVVSRDEILDRVWGYDVYPSTRTVDNFIVRLRKYFEDNSAEPKYLQSVRGTGYRFTRYGKGERG